MLPRLTGKGTSMSRLGGKSGGGGAGGAGGGAGRIGVRGPGEKKLETDRRRIRDRVSKIESGIDDLRKQRERQFAASQEASPIDEQKADEESVPRDVLPLVSTRSSRSHEDEQGKCSGCGKVRAMRNGLIANHQKGLGKMCPGSRLSPG